MLNRFFWWAAGTNTKILRRKASLAEWRLTLNHSVVHFLIAVTLALVIFEDVFYFRFGRLLGELIVLSIFLVILPILLVVLLVNRVVFIFDSCYSGIGCYRSQTAVIVYDYSDSISVADKRILSSNLQDTLHLEDFFMKLKKELLNLQEAIERSRLSLQEAIERSLLSLTVVFRASVKAIERSFLFSEMGGRIYI